LGVVVEGEVVQPGEHLGGDGHSDAPGLVERQVVRALKSYSIATVVDTRTRSGTRGVDLKYQLVDGTLVAQPKYAWWFVGVGWAVENRGMDPDVEVTIAPHDWAAGRDPQAQHRRSAGVAGPAAAATRDSADRLTRSFRITACR
jgi:hypothetical protein